MVRPEKSVSPKLAKDSAMDKITNALYAFRVNIFTLNK